MTSESAVMILSSLAGFAFLLNLPFGYLRGKTRKFSFLWFLYIHLPIPFIFVLRTLAGFGAVVIPVMVVASVLGQLLGGRFHNLKIS